MGQRVDRRKEASKSRRTAILQAARSVFAGQGFQNTSVDDIAAKAGLGKGTLYLYFSSKEEIYMAVLIEDGHALNDLTRERMDAAGSWRERLNAYVQTKMEHLETHQEFIRIYLGETRSMMLRGARVSPELYQVLREGVSHLVQMFASAVARGEIRPVDPELAALTVADLTRGLIERRLLCLCRYNDASDVDFVLDLLFASLTCPGRNQRSSSG
ncbi:MAG TPA: TetR/AcrR family transcriptional regulator [Bryobacteraceae bacterium]|jgi:AcrR family transcriptional regulator|nr:TetR/AcrR family transcriptional regulator [Bryobacteraceae bacterium]